MCNIEDDPDKTILSCVFSNLLYNKDVIDGIDFSYDLL